MRALTMAANRVPFRSVVVFDDDGALLGVEMDCLICMEKGYKGAEAIVEHARLHPMVPASRHDAARLLIVQGRSWLALSETDIERGAKAIKLDPVYRREIVRDAMSRCCEANAPGLLERVRAAVPMLGGDDDA